MPTIEWNYEQWGSQSKTNWSNFGEGWSAPWGGAEMQWFGSIFPRIHRLIPTGTILEIACGYGRWTNFLKNSCDKMIAIDLLEKCVGACKKRFADCSHISYFVNDGKSLAMIADHSVDFIYSFDSLVHVEPVIIQAYVAQFPRILKKQGNVFLHHSNLGEYPHYRTIRKIPKLRGLLARMGLAERSLNNRDLNMSAAKMQAFACEAGLRCISQELVNWCTKSALIDCFSLIATKESSFSHENVLLRNGAFMKEAGRLLKLSRLYAQ